MQISDALLLSLTGFLVVFIALIVLIVLIKAITAVFGRRESAPVAAVLPVPAVPVMETVPAAGASGELELYEVDDYNAALVMAVVADSLKVPLNTLRFKSIRLIEEED